MYSFLSETSKIDKFTFKRYITDNWDLTVTGTYPQVGTQVKKNITTNPW